MSRPAEDQSGEERAERVRSREAVAGRVRLAVAADEIRTRASRTCPEQAMIVELYQLATLVYSTRVLESEGGGRAVPGPPRDLAPVLDRAFGLLDRIGTCQRFFPLFILGAEARTDERRRLLLGLVARTERRFNVGPMGCLREALRAAWVQDDLHADDDVVIKYTHRISAVISIGRTLPSVV